MREKSPFLIKFEVTTGKVHLCGHCTCFCLHNNIGRGVIPCRFKKAVKLLNVLLEGFKLCFKLCGKLVTEFSIELFDALCIFCPESLVNVENPVE